MTNRLAPVLAAGGLAAATTAVVRRMERDYDTHDVLRPSTVAAMYGTYAIHSAAVTWAATRRIWPISAPPEPAIAVGSALTAAGTLVSLAGMGAFDSAAQLTGTESGSLHVSGIYRYTRNPQYLGISAALAGLAIATRSAYAALLAVGVTVTYRRWIPVEERHLSRMFGDTFARYTDRTHRWLGTSRA